jgi:hypothetical protein
MNYDEFYERWKHLVEPIDLTNIGEIFDDVKELLESQKLKDAQICAKPWYRLAPSMMDINPDSLEPLDKNLCQRDLFSFFNDCMGLRANKILNQE